MKIGYSEQKISSGSGDSANEVCASEVPVFCVECPIYTRRAQFDRLTDREVFRSGGKILKMVWNSAAV